MAYVCRTYLLMNCHLDITEPAFLAIFFADTVVVKVPHQKQTCSIFVSRLGLVHHLTFFIWRTVGLFFPKECFYEFAMLAIPKPAFGIVILFGRHLAYYHWRNLWMNFHCNDNYSPQAVHKPWEHDSATIVHLFPIQLQWFMGTYCGTVVFSL